jgi:hypothetical protein
MSFPLCQNFEIISLTVYFTYVFHFDPTFFVYYSKFWKVDELEFAAFMTSTVKTNAQVVKLQIANSNNASSCSCSQNLLSVH